MKVTKIKQSCFKINILNLILYLDPYKIPDGADKADIVLISHSHMDHNDGSSIKKILKDDTKIICPITCKKIMKKWGAKGLNVGESENLEEIEIQGVPAYNISKLKSMLHGNNKGFLGFIIKTKDISFYHAGDTDLIPEMNEFPKNLDLAMLPCGGTFTMNLEDAIEAVKILKPKNVIPMHERGADLKKFEKIVNSDIVGTKFININPGKSVEIN